MFYIQVQVRSSTTPEVAREVNSWSKQSTAPAPVRGPKLPLRRDNFDGSYLKTRADIDMPTAAIFIKGPYLSNKVKIIRFFGPKTQFFKFFEA